MTAAGCFRYIYHVFTEGDVALPSRGMGAIAEQLAEGLPRERIQTGTRVQSIGEGGIVLASGERVKGRAVVLATEGPEAARLLGAPQSVGSRGELYIYFSAKEPPIAEPYLILNGDGTGWVNSLTVPSIVAPSYSPAGQHLISVMVISHLDADDTTVEAAARREITAWFGPAVDDWRHLKTCRILHALPAQSPPMPDPTVPSPPIKPGIFVCGEYGSVPGIQWALLSGRHAAEGVIKELGKDG
jgi:phytoene dehydrogenase-like protein